MFAKSESGGQVLILKGKEGRAPAGCRFPGPLRGPEAETAPADLSWGTPAPRSLLLGVSLRVEQADVSSRFPER